MEKKIIGYRCNADHENQFTKGKIYKLRPGKNLWDYEAFVDDLGIPNGWSIYNGEYFEPVYEEDVKTVKDIINSIYGLVLNKNIGTNINPELTQYLNSINNKMENKKIYYLKQEVKLNQEIDFNGLKIKVTQDLINNNPNLFHVEEYNKQQDIIKNLPEYVKHKISNKIYKVSYNPNDDKFIIKLNDSIKYFDVDHLLKYNMPSTKEEYDLQEELQQLLDEAQKRYPVGTKLSKDLTVTLHPNKKTYLVYKEDKRVSVHVGFGIYQRVKSELEDWLPEYKEPVKDLKYYENKFNSDFYTVLLLKHPNLYYQLILQTIADDLNGDWKPDWIGSNKADKHVIRYFGNKLEIASYLGAKHSNVYFKSIELAQQAIDIMGEDKLKIIFNIK